jgi:hypothetical protein
MSSIANLLLQLWHDLTCATSRREFYRNNPSARPGDYDRPEVQAWLNATCEGES